MSNIKKFLENLMVSLRIDLEINEETRNEAILDRWQQGYLRGEDEAMKKVLYELEKIVRIAD